MANIAVVLRELEQERDRLDKAIAALKPLAGPSTDRVTTIPKSPRRTLSAVARRKIATAQRARWASVKAARNEGSSKGSRPRVVSAAARRKMAAAQRARWARVR